ncbi:MAG: hypothetical protein NVV68_04040 [Dokdonella sp.]|nr:hypothetical protein [Dokdonella sp.]
MSKSLLALSVGLLCAAGAQAASFSTTPQSLGNVPAAACPTGPGNLSHNTDCAPLQGTVACGATGLATTAENSYYRRYVLAAGTTPGASVSSVHIGIESTTSGTGGDVSGMEVRIYTIPTGSALTTGNLTLIGSAPFTSPDGNVLAELDLPISPAAVIDTPATKDIVVELFQPDLEPSASAFVFGSNPTGSGITYLRAPDCGADQPVDIASLGAFSNVKVIAALAGQGLPVSLQDFTIE